MTEQSRSRRSWRVAGTSIATRLAASVVAVSVVSLVIATLVGVTTGRDLADDINDERLVATVESAAFDVGRELGSLESTAETLAVSPQAVIALERFGTAFGDLETEMLTDEELTAVVTEVQTEYLEPLVAAGRDVQLRDLISTNDASRYLQYEYAVDIEPASRPRVVDDADDGTDWTEVHRVVHPVYRDVTQQVDLVDLYLVEPDGTIVYSVNKRPDLGSNLVVGPYSGSVLATTFDRVVADPDGGAVVSDLRYYDAVPGEPIGVVAAPVVDGSRLVGVLMMSYDAAEVTRLVAADETFIETGEVYIIGSDGATRSDPRTFLEDPDAHLEAAEAAGTITPEGRSVVEEVGTTVLIQNAVDATRDAARSADTDVATRTNMVGSEVISIVAPIDFEGLRWFVVAEADREVADRELGDFQELLIVGVAIFVVIVAFLAVAWASGIARPIRNVSDRISTHGRTRVEWSDEPITAPPESPVEIQQLAVNLETMRSTLHTQQEQVADARTERLSLLRSLLPPSVAERIGTGDVQALEQAPAATVVVVVVLGLADLVRADSEHADRELVDQLHVELDELAAQHGLDRIKVVGDAYYAVCGHDRQYIDHAPRSIGFAVDALDAIHGMESPVPLDVAVGIHSGPVTTGMAGGAQLVYDVWGPTVARAHELARRAVDGEILLTETSRVLLPESISTEPTDDATETHRVSPNTERVWT